MSVSISIEEAIEIVQKVIDKFSAISNTLEKDEDIELLWRIPLENVKNKFKLKQVSELESTLRKKEFDMETNRIATMNNDIGEFHVAPATAYEEQP